MSRAYRLTPLALDDLDSIWSYIAQDSIEAADRVEAEIFASCERLATNPRLGSTRPVLTQLAVRFWPVPRFPNYLIVYYPETNPLQIVAVLQGRRNLRNVLRGRGSEG